MGAAPACDPSTASAARAQATRTDGFRRIIMRFAFV
jgi:hypothetical protein